MNGRMMFDPICIKARLMRTFQDRTSDSFVRKSGQRHLASGIALGPVHLGPAAHRPSQKFWRPAARAPLGSTSSRNHPRVVLAKLCGVSGCAPSAASAIAVVTVHATWDVGLCRTIPPGSSFLTLFTWVGPVRTMWTGRSRAAWDHAVRSSFVHCHSFIRFHSFFKIASPSAF